MRDKSFKTVLLVNDNEQIRSAYAACLQGAGYEVWEASTGAEGLTLAGKKPSLIVLEIQLPDTSGFDVCARVKADPKTRSIPILQTSAASVGSGDQIRALESGADAFLLAPIHPKELVATVRALLERKQPAISKSEAMQWDPAFEAISDGICLVSASGCIERCNVAFARIFRKSVTEIVGCSFSEFAPDLPVSKGEKKVSEIQVGNLWLRISADPVRSKTKRLGGAIYLVTDISERKEAEIALATRNEQITSHALKLEKEAGERAVELERTVKSLDTFCYTIAHDLKSPLRSIKGFTAILREEYADKMDDAGKDYSKRIVDSVERMNGLIDALLDFGRLSNMDLPMESVNLEEELEFVLHELWADSNAKDADIKLCPPFPLVQANSNVIRQVLSNLISNAIKFVSPGVRPKIEVSAATKKGMVRISVQDNGIGIEPESYIRIFEVFERLHGKDSGYPGTGIGLAIVRKGVERMGGSVGVDSQLDKGSRFWFELRQAR